MSNLLQAIMDWIGTKRTLRTGLRPDERRTFEKDLHEAKVQFESELRDFVRREVAAGMRDRFGREGT